MAHGVWKHKHNFLIAANIVISAAILANFIVSSTTQAGTPNPTVLGNTSYIAPAYKNGLVQSTATAVNSLRKSKGLSKISQSTELDAIAKMRANDMAKNSYYAHKDPRGKIFADYMREQGINYSYACENLNTMDNPSAKGYVDSWYKSDAGHRECMLNPGHASAGYAIAEIKFVNGIPLNQKVIVAIYSD